MSSRPKALRTKALRSGTTAFLVCGLALFLASCAPQDAQPAKESGGDAPKTQDIAFAWSADSDCGTCHERDVQSFDDADCVASQHADLQGQCLTCHNDEPGLEKTHAKVTLDSEKKKQTLKKTEVPEAACVGCHDKEDLVAATASSTALTDKNGLTVNPHDLPVNDDHAAKGLTCASCHKIHADEPSAEVAPGICLNCHHADVYECNTCHLEK